MKHDTAPSLVCLITPRPAVPRKDCSRLALKIHEWENTHNVSVHMEWLTWNGLTLPFVVCYRLMHHY